MCGNTHTGKTQKNYFNSEGIIQMFLIPLNNVLISKRKNNIFLFDFYDENCGILPLKTHIWVLGYWCAIMAIIAIIAMANDCTDMAMLGIQ